MNEKLLSHEVKDNRHDQSPTNEQLVEDTLRPLQELVDCEVFFPVNATTPWYVTVEWEEPELDAQNQVSLGPRSKFSGEGPLNNEFLTWARRHYSFWVDKAHVPIKVIRIEQLKETDPRRENRTW